MARTTSNTNPIKIKIRITFEQREYLKMLATDRSIVPNGTVDYLLTTALIAFMVEAPWTKKSWSWTHPETDYVVVDGKKYRSEKWTMILPNLVDVTIHDKVVESKFVLALIKTLAEKLDQPQQTVTSSAVEWITTKHFPPEIYDIRVRKGPKIDRERFLQLLETDTVKS